MSDEGTPPGDQDHPDRIRTLFAEAIDLPESARTAFIEAQCSDDPDLAAELLEMLSGHAETVRDPSGGRDASASGHQASTHLQPGQSIGPFKILEQLGEGGFGVVYLAEQTDSITRRVAIKLIRSGLNTEHLLARFNVERQTLTKMDHPGIARVLDASQTPDGHPYFVMEYVEGENLTDYCDSQKLDMRARLEIFADLCDAVQHAHRKGIIHRDLKPGNILVKTEETGAAQPKVIDFGIAKDPDQALTVGSSPMGTYAYMPPEQADPLRTDIDTRADVYSLGVILYELLTGSIPFNPSDFSDRGVSEFQRALREDDPPRPSTRITTMEAAEGSAISEARATQSATLASTLRRELEWIPLKALRKEPDERYESAAALGEDVRRYLRGEALEAGPESTGYRLRKLIFRNKGPLIAVTLIGLALIAGIIGMTLFTLKDQQLQMQELQLKSQEGQILQTQRESEDTNAVKGFVTTMFSSIDPAVAGDMDKALMMMVLSKAADAVGEQFADQPLIEAEIRTVIGQTYMSLGMYREAEAHIKGAFEGHSKLLNESHEDRLTSTSSMGILLYSQGKYDEALPYYTEALEGQRRVLGNGHQSTLYSINNMGELLYGQGKYDEALLYITEALETRRRVLGDEHLETLTSINNMGYLLERQGKYDEALLYLTEALETSRRVLGDEHPTTLNSINNMGYLLSGQGKYDDALPYFTEALESRRRVLGDEHPDTLWTINAMGDLLYKQDKYHKALPYLTEALESSRRVLGDEHPETLRSIYAMGNLLESQGKYDEALLYITEVLESSRRVLGDEHPGTLRSINAMGNLLSSQGKYGEALPYYTEALETRRRVLGDEHLETLTSINNMGYLLYKQDKYHKALPYLTEALESSRRVLGDEHPETLSLAFNYAKILQKINRFIEARDIAEFCIRGYSKSMGPSHDFTMASINMNIAIHDALHTQDPTAGHDAKAQEWRAEEAWWNERAGRNTTNSVESVEP